MGFTAIRCCKCGYVMNKSLEVQSAIVKAGYDIAHFMNSIPIPHRHMVVRN